MSINLFVASTGRWTILPPMPEVLHNIDSAECSYKGCLFICGGLRAGDSVSAAFGCYSPERQTWELLPNMPIPCSHPGFVGLAGHVYVLGGCVSSDDSHDLSTVSRYSITDGK